MTHLNKELILDSSKLNFNHEGIEMVNRCKIKYVYYGQTDPGTGKPHGIGRCIMSDNTIHEGLFENGHLNGHGRSFYPDGTYFIGSHVKGKREGFGQTSSFHLRHQNVIYVGGTRKDEWDLVDPNKDPDKTGKQQKGKGPFGFFGQFLGGPTVHMGYDDSSDY